MTDSSGNDDADDGSQLSATRRTVLRGTAAGIGVASLGGLPDLGATRGGSGGRRFRVRIENTAAPDALPADSSTGGAVLVTPGAYATHDGPNPILTEGEAASEGLEAIAEAGRPGGTPENDGLVGELRGADGVTSAGAFTPADTVADPNDPTGERPGIPPIAPGGAYEFTVRANPGDGLSFASMFVPSNDLFFAPGDDGIDLFENGGPVSGDVTDQVALWDAGTEPNQRPGFGDDQAPAQDDPDQGADEGGVVRPVDEVADGYSYPDASDALRVTVTPVETRPFRVRIENTADPDTYADDASTGGAVLVTPGAYATHNGSNPILAEGEPASEGLEAVAEAGRPGGTPENRGLVDELGEDGRVTEAGAFTPGDTVMDPNDPSGEEPGIPPIAPGGAYEFTVDAAPGERLSFASMFVPSNDLFFAPGEGGIAMFDGADPVSGDVTDQVALWDAGTEPNQRPGFGDDQAPAQDDPDQGADEGGVVRPIDEVADGYSYPDASDALRVTVMPVDPTPFQVRIENTAAPDALPADSSTGGAVLLTPGAYATHVGSSPVLSEGEAASEGLEAVAEAGRPGGTPENRGLVAELAETSNVTSSGAFTPEDTAADPNDPSGEQPGIPPIAPGGAYEFTVTAVPGERFSFASMFVPSNDLFYAPGDGGIDLFDGSDPVSGDVTDQVGLWDAGTEPNQEPGFGDDQAPAQDDPDQGADEGGVVRPIGEVADGYSYPDDVIRVSVTPSPASRRLARTAVPAGGSVEVTLTVDLEEALDRVILIDSFSGPVEGSSVDSVTADGVALARDDLAVVTELAEGVAVGIEGTDADTTLEVDYTVDLSTDAAPGDTVEFGGNEEGPDVTGDTVVEAEFGTATARVTTGAGPVARADRDGDGDITTSELRRAISDWAQGRYSTDQLRAIVRAWAAS